MTRYQLLNTLLHVIVFFMGAGIGSFLNVVIYRLPRGLSVNQPRRSFCPACKYQIPIWHNIPLVSWVLLRGKCANCGAPISARYFWVEALVGVLFYATFLRLSHSDWSQIAVWGPLLLATWLFIALLVSGTFIDIEHFILPHEITIGGTVAGLACASAFPALLGETSHLRGFLVSLGSAALGLGLLWAVVELGKLAFGRKRFRFDRSEAWEVSQPDESAPPIVRIAGDELTWEDIFTRASDRLVVSSDTLQLNDQAWKDVTAELWMEKLRVRRDKDLLHEQTWDDVRVIHGTTREVVIPREAMGFGDVLFLMMIGAFAGWQAVLFTLLAASVLGTLIAMLQRVTGRAEWGAKIPFGPYLAAGALLWVFYGPQVVDWYFSQLAWRSALPA
jgi:leader peptidase (prepilin peptidase)/N-methyltransferase